MINTLKEIDNGIRSIVLIGFLKAVEPEEKILLFPSNPPKFDEKDWLESQMNNVTGGLVDNCGSPPPVTPPPTTVNNNTNNNAVNNANHNANNNANHNVNNNANHNANNNAANAAAIAAQHQAQLQAQQQSLTSNVHAAGGAGGSVGNVAGGSVGNVGSSSNSSLHTGNIGSTSGVTLANGAVTGGSSTISDGAVRNNVAGGTSNSASTATVADGAVRNTVAGGTSSASVASGAVQNQTSTANSNNSTYTTNYKAAAASAIAPNLITSNGNGCFRGKGGVSVGISTVAGGVSFGIGGGTEYEMVNIEFTDTDKTKYTKKIHHCVSDNAAMMVIQNGQNPNASRGDKVVAVTTAASMSPHVMGALQSGAANKAALAFLFDDVATKEPLRCRTSIRTWEWACGPN